MSSNGQWRLYSIYGSFNVFINTRLSTVPLLLSIVTHSSYNIIDYKPHSIYLQQVIVIDFVTLDIQALPLVLNRQHHWFTLNVFTWSSLGWRSYTFLSLLWFFLNFLITIVLNYFYNLIYISYFLVIDSHYNLLINHYCAHWPVLSYSLPHSH